MYFPASCGTGATDSILGQPNLDMMDSRERNSYFSLESRKLENMSFIKDASWPALELGKNAIESST